MNNEREGGNYAGNMLWIGGRWPNYRATDHAYCDGYLRVNQPQGTAALTVLVKLFVSMLALIDCSVSKPCARAHPSVG